MCRTRWHGLCSVAAEYSSRLHVRTPVPGGTQQLLLPDFSLDIEEEAARLGDNDLLLITSAGDTKGRRKIFRTVPIA